MSDAFQLDAVRSAQPAAVPSEVQVIPEPKPTVRPGAPAAQSQLIVVSNRLPVQRGRGESGWQRSPGGLVSAMDPLLQRRGGRWVGWPGGSTGSNERLEVDGMEVRTVALTRRELAAYYDGFSNSTLWPLYHGVVRPPVIERAWWPVYESINRRFAEATLEVSSENDLLWIHDYQLQLVPALLRERRPGARIGFFLHIPFPPLELFARLPWRQEILHGLLGADVVGFQRAEDAAQFIKAARHFAHARKTHGALQHGGRQVLAECFPISIDFPVYDALGQDPAVIARARQLRESFGPERRIVLSVDRLDYTKGIEKRLAAFEDLLQRGAADVDGCVMIQVAVPSREQVDAYSELRAEVEELVGRINGQFGTPGRVAVHYFRRSLQRRELVAFYRAADVMFVTPVKDGMNLVAKEYVASRSDQRGALVLSEFTGAAAELRQALIVNPFDVHGVSLALERALSMPEGEQRRRMAQMRRTVQHNDVHRWGDRFLSTLEQHAAHPSHA